MRLNLPVSSREVTVAETANILSTTDLQGTITYANPDFVAISGFTEDELLGEHHNTVRIRICLRRHLPIFGRRYRRTSRGWAW